MKSWSIFSESISNSLELNKILDKYIVYDIDRGSSVYFRMSSEDWNNLVKNVYEYINPNVDIKEFETSLMNLIPLNFDLDSEDDIVEDYDGKKFKYFRISRDCWNDYHDYDGDDDFDNSSHDDMYVDYEGLSDEIIKIF